MEWFLVTGAPNADIGKGSLCAAVARRLERGGHSVAYQKMEPCLQKSLDRVPNGSVGEIVRLNDGRCADFDVARVLFYAPQTALGSTPDLSLWRCLNENGQVDLPSPRIIAETAAGIAGHIPSGSDFLVVEVGGTLGEPEHRILLDGLVHALGLPSQHLVVGSILRDPSGRKTTKPLQICLGLSAISPDVIFIRGAATADLMPLTSGFGKACRFVRIDESINPVRACMAALDAAYIPHLQADEFDPQHEIKERRGAVGIHGDTVESRRYESLGMRIDCWSKGRIGLINGSDAKEKLCGIIAAGKAKFQCALPMLQISAADTEKRSDWEGHADAPRGDVADFVRAAESFLDGASPESAYVNDAFVREYIARSRSGELRDHGIMDKIAWQYLPKGNALRSARILDIGCGYGRWAARLISEGAGAIVGVEPSPQMCDELRSRKLPRFQLLQAGIETATIEGFFDVALAMMSLDHVSDLPSVARLISAHLKPKGRLIVTTEHPWRTSTGANRWRTHPEDALRRQAIVDNYCSEGSRIFTWFGRPEPVVVQHRTIETWTRVLIGAGLGILSIHEPASSDSRDGGVPRFWLLCAEKKD